MALEEDEKCQRSRFECTVGAEPQDAHGDEDGRLHEHPSDLVRNGRPVAGVEQIAVPRLEEVQGDEDNQGQEGHDEQEDVEGCGHAQKGIFGAVKLRNNSHRDNPLRRFCSSKGSRSSPDVA